MKFLIVAGARPNFMKIAPLIRAISAHNSQGKPRIDYVLVHTGQHYDEKMSSIFFKELGIPAPHINLEVGSGSHAVQTANVMLKFEPVCQRENPDWLIVVGDVNSTMACTLVASKLGIKVAHVEAGLRSFDRTMPEEVNRLVTDVLADLLLTPSADGDENLKREGVPQSKIRLVGNIMIDALVDNLDKARQTGILARVGLKRKNYVYVTLHRPSNVDNPDALRKIVDVFSTVAREIPIVFPIHPRTRQRLNDLGIEISTVPNLSVLEPVGYHESLCLTENARLVLTDSGGLQEESTYFRTPCLTLRPNTERPVTISHGSNKLTTVQMLISDMQTVLGSDKSYGTPPLWDGHTASRVISELLAANRQ